MKQTYIVERDFNLSGPVRKGDELELTGRQARSLRIAGFIKAKTKAAQAKPKSPGKTVSRETKNQNKSDK